MELIIGHGTITTSRRRGRPRIETPNPIDVRVGTRLRLRRNMLGLSQERLGEAIGVTFQQVQKYERGANRIGASRLHELSRVLDVPVSFFSTIPIRCARRRWTALPGLRSKPSNPTRCASARQSSSSGPICDRGCDGPPALPRSRESARFGIGRN